MFAKRATGGASTRGTNTNTVGQSATVANEIRAVSISNENMKRCDNVHTIVQ